MIAFPDLKVQRAECANAMGAGKWWSERTTNTNQSLTIIYITKPANSHHVGATELERFDFRKFVLDDHCVLVDINKAAVLSHKQLDKTLGTISRPGRYGEFFLVW